MNKYLHAIRCYPYQSVLTYVNENNITDIVSITAEYCHVTDKTFFWLFYRSNDTNYTKLPNS